MCWIKLITLGFLVHVKLVHRIVSSVKYCLTDKVVGTLMPLHWILVTGACPSIKQLLGKQLL